MIYSVVLDLMMDYTQYSSPYWRTIDRPNRSAEKKKFVKSIADISFLYDDIPVKEKKARYRQVIKDKAINYLKHIGKPGDYWHFIVSKRQHAHMSNLVRLLKLEVVLKTAPAYNTIHPPATKFDGTIEPGRNIVYLIKHKEFE